ncbi:sensor histidine kinase [Piscinibacter koreensis]|uniref:histidine kinase n=1 Tax=Piscinibacter koreensis TaxID=2742824 RepID=A0A7Y6NTE6_9BURK|nr:HAMP domain-containing sensor histidine kinase [Schlegelella koreensis]NUZ08995.1 HAMP domain-containing histidine kinase [Schlegelella koreensis]
MEFGIFIEQNVDLIIKEWEGFARASIPPAESMSTLALRNHSREILLEIAKGMKTNRAGGEPLVRSSGEQEGSETAARLHGELRRASGFTIVQLFAEFRAMRESILALWRHADGTPDREQAIEEIARFNEGIDRAIAQSLDSYERDLDRSRDTFLGVLGHDLRSPLTVVEMSSQILARLDLPAPGQQTVQRIRRSTRTMAQLISDLLEYTRSQLGKGIPIHRKPCDLRQLLDEAIDTAQTSHPAHEFLLELSGDFEIAADAARIQQVLSNLLNNAVHHGAPGTPVALRGSQEEEAVVLTVSNAGAPIPPDALQDIFEPLVQLSRNAAEQPEPGRTNLGLGLFIVREIVRGHGGEIAVRSSAEEGTVFTVRLPRTDNAAGATSIEP